MKTKHKIILLGLLLISAVITTKLSIANNSQDLSDLTIANIEAIADGEGGGDKKENEWWDAFNNYAEYEWVSANSVYSNEYSVSNGAWTLIISSERHLTQCKVGSCYDGGNRDECYRSHWVAYCI